MQNNPLVIKNAVIHVPKIEYHKPGVVLFMSTTQKDHYALGVMATKKSLPVQGANTTESLLQTTGEINQ